jgi:hypothetical protein
VHIISPDVAASQTGHGNVMPMSLHGGPGRAGGGEELGGLRALGFYHRRSAVQASSAALDVLAATRRLSEPDPRLRGLNDRGPEAGSKGSLGFDRLSRNGV